MKSSVKKLLNSGKNFEISGVSYGVRRKTFKRGNFEFNPHTLVATSYSWWTFAKPFNGVVVFNEGRYSVTTSKHQNYLRRMLNEMKVKYITVDIGTADLGHELIFTMLEKTYIQMYLAERRESRSRTRSYYSASLKATIKALISLDKDISAEAKKQCASMAEELDNRELARKREASKESREKAALKRQLLKTVEQPTNELASN